MERKIISHRIGSILDDISRLSNALYAMDTTDIQRYPDNYEVLSTDAALRAEKIACRLRHLIYSSTTIRKGDCPTCRNIVFRPGFRGFFLSLHHGFLPKFLAVSVKATHHKEVITWEIPTARHDGVQASLSDCHLRRVPHRPA